MKKFFLSLAALLLSAGAATVSAMAILTVNGEQVEKVPTRLTFDGDNVIVHYGDATTTTHDMADVTIAFDGSTGLESLETFSFNGAIAGGILDVAGVKAGQPVTVFTIAGQAATAATADAQGRASLDISALQPGVYVLQAGNNIVKFVKR